MKTYLELEGKLDQNLNPSPISLDPLNPTQTPCKERFQNNWKEEEIDSHKETQSKGGGQAQFWQCNCTTSPNKPWGPNEFQRSEVLARKHARKWPPTIRKHPRSCQYPLVQSKKDWPIPPTNSTITATNSKPPIKIECWEQDQPTPSATAPSKPE